MLCAFFAISRRIKGIKMVKPDTRTVGSKSDISSAFVGCSAR